MEAGAVLFLDEPVEAPVVVESSVVLRTPADRFTAFQATINLVNRADMDRMGVQRYSSIEFYPPATVVLTVTRAWMNLSRSKQYDDLKSVHEAWLTSGGRTGLVIIRAIDGSELMRLGS